MPPARASALVSLAKPDARALVAAWTAAALVLATGCSGRAGEATENGTCRPPKNPMPMSGACVVPLDRSSPGSTGTCEATWDGPATPVCIPMDPIVWAYDYRGPSGGYLVKTFRGSLGGSMCVYDTGTKALIARYEYTDTLEYCCRSSFDQWQGRAVREAWPEREACQRAVVDGGASDGGVDGPDGAGAGVDATDAQD